MHWINDNLIECDDVTITVDYKEAQESSESTRQKFILAKSRTIVDRYQKKLTGEKTERILELGIFKGGSAVLFHKMLNPVKLIAIDLHDTRVAALDDYIASTKAENIIKPYYGVNQADKKNSNANY